MREGVRGSRERQRHLLKSWLRSCCERTCRMVAGISQGGESVGGVFPSAAAVKPTQQRLGCSKVTMSCSIGSTSRSVSCRRLLVRSVFVDIWFSSLGGLFFTFPLIPTPLNHNIQCQCRQIWLPCITVSSNGLFRDAGCCLLPRCKQRRR